MHLITYFHLYIYVIVVENNSLIKNISTLYYFMFLRNLDQHSVHGSAKLAEAIVKSNENICGYKTTVRHCMRKEPWVLGNEL